MYRKHNPRPNPRPGTRREPVTQGEVDRLLEAPVSDGSGALVQLAVHTGARVSELAALRWEDVDFDAAAIILPADKTEARTVPMPPTLAPVLEAWRSEGNAKPGRRRGREPVPAAAGPGYVFPARNGGPRSPAALQRRFARLSRRTLGREISHHQIRQWFIAAHDPHQT